MANMANFERSYQLSFQERTLKQLETTQFFDLKSEDLVKEGGFGKVYKYRSSAVKQINRVGKVHRLCAYNEVAIANRVMDHTNIIKVLGYQITETEKPLIIFEWCEGTNLHDFVKNSHISKITQTQKCDMILQCVRAFIHLHSLTILHRDIKPTNIMIGFDASKLLPEQILKVKIIDFGLSTMETGHGKKIFIVNEDIYNLNRAAKKQSFFKSPESLIDQSHYEKPSEVYSFGFIMHLVAVGKFDHYPYNVQVTKYDHLECLMHFHKSLTYWPHNYFKNQYKQLIIGATQFAASKRMKFEEIRTKLWDVYSKSINGTDPESDNESRIGHNESLQVPDRQPKAVDKWLSKINNLNTIIPSALDPNHTPPSEPFRRSQSISTGSTISRLRFCSRVSQVASSVSRRIRSSRSQADDTVGLTGSHEHPVGPAVPTTAIPRSRLGLVMKENPVYRSVDPEPYEVLHTSTSAATQSQSARRIGSVICDRIDFFSRKSDVKFLPHE